MSRLFPKKNLDKISTCVSTPGVATEPAKRRKSKLKMQQEFMNKIIANEKDINIEIFCKYFKYQNLSFLAKYLIRATQAKTEQLVNSVNDGLIDLRSAIIRKEIPESENPNKIVDIVEKKGNGIKVLSPKQMLQRLPITLAQVKSANISENKPNKIRQIIYSLF